MGGLGTLTNVNFQLLNSGQANHVTSVPTVDGNKDRVVTTKCVHVGELDAHDLPSFCDELSVGVTEISVLA